MASPPVTHDDGKNHNATPSVEQRKTLNFDVDAGNQLGFPDLSDTVNLGVDYQLGFSQVQPTKKADVTDGAQGPETGVPEKETSDSCESSRKKLKLSENALGFGSVGVFSGDQLNNVEEITGKCNGNLVSGGEQIPEDCCKDIPIDKIFGSGEDAENHVVQIENGAMRSSDEVPEASGVTNEKLGLRVLPPLILGTLQNGAVELGSAGEGQENKKFCVFDVLRVLSENDGDCDYDGEGFSLLHAAKSLGVTFPRPRWWPEGMDAELDILKLFKKLS